MLATEPMYQAQRDKRMVLPTLKKDDDVAWWVDSGATMHYSKLKLNYNKSMIKRFRTDKGGEYMDTLVPNKRNKITPYELQTKRKHKLTYLRVWGCREAVRLFDPKLKTLGHRGIECIFVGYAEHSKAY
nr:zinc finger, CCHC-type [Tanacetum cinerariifolium]